jgi:hypothetical protein
MLRLLTDRDQLGGIAEPDLVPGGSTSAALIRWEVLRSTGMRQAQGQNRLQGTGKPPRLSIEKQGARRSICDLSVCLQAPIYL